MPVTREVAEQIGTVFTDMETQANWSAASSGPADEPDTRSAHDGRSNEEWYADQWMHEEDSGSFWLGGPNFPDRPTMILALNAIRALNVGHREQAAALLKLALAETEK